jgi:hypothetical protein
MMRIPIATKSNTSRSRALSAERVVNMAAQIQPEGAKSPVALFSSPGLTSFGSIGSGPIRGMHVMGGALYVVSADGVYKVLANGAATLLGSIGTAAGAVHMVDNGTQIFLVDNPNGWVVTSTTLTQITDADWPGAATCAYLDGYGILNDPDTGRFYVTSLLDFSTVDALDFATAESAPDDILRVFVDHRELWLFGSHSTEVWVNTGNADFPFERQPGSILERGTAAAGSVAKMDSSTFWLGDDRIVYRANGYQPMRISTHAIEQAIAGYATVSDAVAFSYALDGHTYYVLTFPTEAATWVYDASTQQWHERDSRASDISLGRWRAQSYAYCYGKHLVGDYSAGTVWEMSTSVHAEGSEDLVRLIQFPPLYAEGKRAFMYSLEVDMEVGVGLSGGQGSDPQVMLQWSDDGGNTWSNEHWKSIGPLGEYRTRVTWERLGSFRQRTLRLSVSDPVRCVIYGAMAEIVGGSS